MQNDREIGNAYEKEACLYLQKQGVRILKRNFRIRQGEIDIIGLQDGVLIFFEVKYRKNTRKGYPQEAVGRRKQIQISRIAMFYFSFYHIPMEHPSRFDVISICGDEIVWIKDAFTFIGG